MHLEFDHNGYSIACDWSSDNGFSNLVVRPIKNGLAGKPLNIGDDTVRRDYWIEVVEHYMEEKIRV